MTGTATWTTTPIPAWRVEPGDRITVDDGRVCTVTAVYAAGGTTRIILDRFPDGMPWTGDRTTVTVHVPDEPVDGYDLFKPRPGWSPLGCTCVSRRGDDRNWHIVATDDGCASHGNGDLYDD